MKQISWQGGGGQYGFDMMSGAANWADTAAVNGIRFYMASGDIFGTFRLYGIKNS